jgi:hypothetical protein
LSRDPRRPWAGPAANPTSAPENRRAQGQAPTRGTSHPTRSLAPHAAARMKTLLRTAPPQASRLRRGPSASVTFTNPVHPINQRRPGTPAAARNTRPGRRTAEPNHIFSECRSGKPVNRSHQ